MFLPLELRSINSPDQLPLGTYRAARLGYLHPVSGARLLQFTYTRNDDDQPAACDLLIVDADGTVRSCDFMRLADRAWRDSFGAKADALSTLLPDDISDYQLVDEADLGDIVLEEFT